MDNTIITNDDIIPDNNQETNNDVKDIETKIIKWFKTEYEQDLPNNNPSNIKIIELLDHLKNSETFENFSKQDKNKYGRNTFIDYIRNNLFFKKYFHERHNGLRNIIRGWHLKTEELNM